MVVLGGGAFLMSEVSLYGRGFRARGPGSPNFVKRSGRVWLQWGGTPGLRPYLTDCIYQLISESQLFTKSSTSFLHLPIVIFR
jgi:hypothetical protein